MHIRSLQLVNFRNFRRLNLALPTGPVVILGGNAQGKSNLLEAIYLLCTGRSLHAATDAELILHQALAEELPAARLTADVQRRRDSVRVEMVITGYGGDQGRTSGSKRVRIDGVPRRLSDIVGQIHGVLFTADDLDLITGPPALRRRYLDITISQVDRAYLSSLQRYVRVLVQRNHLLRQIHDGAQRQAEMAFWNREMVAAGSYIIRERARTVTALNDDAREAHGRLTEGQEQLGLVYQPHIGDAMWGEEIASASLEKLAAVYCSALEAVAQREAAAGMSLLGPHRDDLSFLVDGAPAAAYASRAQQRTVALSLRLAEAAYLQRQSGDSPVLLLDDVLSELDRRRRRSVMTALEGYQQVVLTATEADRFSSAFLEQATVFAFTRGQLEPWERDAEG